MTPGNGVTSHNAKAKGGDPDHVRSAHDVVQVISSASRRLHESDGQKAKPQSSEDDGWDEGGGASAKSGSASAGKRQERQSDGFAPQPARKREASTSSQKKLPQQPVDIKDTQPPQKQLEEDQPDKLPFYLPKPGSGSSPEGAESKPAKASQSPQASGSPTQTKQASSDDTQKMAWPAQQPQWSSKQQDAGACVMKADEAKCSGRGVCMQNGDCQCLQGYAGQYCEIQCPRANGQPVYHHLHTMSTHARDFLHMMQMCEMT